MANKRVTSKDDPLVQTIIYVPKSLKDVLDNFSKSAGKSISALFREWAMTQLDGHAAELSKLKEEKRQHEAALNIIDAQIKELEAETSKQQNAITLRENLFNQQVDELVNILIRDGGFIQELDRPIKFRVQGMNSKLNGSGAQPFTVEELRQAVIEKAKAEGLRVHGC